MGEDSEERHLGEECECLLYEGCKWGMSKLHWQSWDYPRTTFPPSTSVAEYPGTPELHCQSQDYSGTTTLPAPLWQGIPERQSNTGSPGIISGLASLQHLCGRVSQSTGVTPAVPGLSRDYLPFQHPSGRVSWNSQEIQKDNEQTRCHIVIRLGVNKLNMKMRKSSFIKQ